MCPPILTLLRVSGVFFSACRVEYVAPLSAIERDYNQPIVIKVSDVYEQFAQLTSSLWSTMSLRSAQ